MNIKNYYRIIKIILIFKIFLYINYILYNKMNIDNDQKTELELHLQFLSNFENNGFKIENINFQTKELTLGKNNEKNKYKFDEIINVQNIEGENNLTFDMQTDQKNYPKDLSETIVNQNSVNNTSVHIGGNNKNIFKSSKYSDTSSVKLTEMSNYSKTSSAMFNDRSDNFSDTSVIGQVGGILDSTDTLMSISELKDRKKKLGSTVSSSTFTFKSNLDLGIFKKTQSGGSNSDLKKKMLEAGINSSSTSSLCE